MLAFFRILCALHVANGYPFLAEIGEGIPFFWSYPRYISNHCCCCCCLLFLTFSVLVANPEKLLYTVANPARGLLNREKRTKEKVWQHTPPPHPHTARSEKINKITRRIYRRYAGGRSRVRTRIPSARRLGLWVWLRKILHSRLR